MWRIGLTGGIGSGKSTVARLLVDHGATLVDTDAIARSLTEPDGPAMPALKAHFGSHVVDSTGALDRVAMRGLVFADPGAKQQLEAILHPLIRERVEQQTIACATPVLVLDVPLLVESGRWRDRVDQVWLVDCEEETQVARVLQRPGWTDVGVRAVLAQQASRAQRRCAADVVIYNDRINLAQLAQQVEGLWQELAGSLIPSP
ncbi:MAG: dephospho-CoA kinase [Rhizobacter sp.]